eukprot:jgi/Tetstr1/428259/TSEL_018298.t1
MSRTHRSRGVAVLALTLLFGLVVATVGKDAAINAPEDPLANVYDSVGWTGRMITLSAHSPRAYVYKNFLSPEECDHLIDKAERTLAPSHVVNNTDGGSFLSKDRTSTSTSFLKGEDEVIARIEKRISAITHIPVGHGEPLQVLKYVNGQKYDQHYDYFHDDVNSAPDKGGQRIATVLMYLSTVPEGGGGETTFPDAKYGQGSGDEWSECARNKLAVRTMKGDALVFYSLHMDGAKDPTSLHASCPTTNGQKYTMTKWIRINPIGNVCRDQHESCLAWANIGECEKTKTYMHQNCREACKLCEYTW